MIKEIVVVLTGNLEGREFEAHSRLTIGRSAENHLHLADNLSSRFHAEIVEEDGGFKVRDLESRNGTMVNGELIKEKVLSHDDEIQIGDTRMRFRVIEEEEAEVDDDLSATMVSFEVSKSGSETLAEIDAAAVDVVPAAEIVDREAEIESIRKRFSVLNEANKLVSGEVPVEQVYDSILEQLFSVVPADRGIILVRDSESGELGLSAVRSRDPSVDVSQINVSRTISVKAMTQRVAILTADAGSDSQFEAGASILAQDIRSAICAPLVHGDDVLGIIYLDTQGMVHAFDQNMLQLVTAIAGPAAIAIQNANYIEELKAKSEQIRQAYLDTITVVANSIEARDKYTIGHTWRVTRFGLAIAEQLGWDEKKVKLLEMGGVLHDVGKVGVDDAILRKPGKLTDEEFAKMKLHPEIGARILRDIAFLEPVLSYVLYHHERWDGRGYPERRKEKDIPIEGRLLAVGDTFDAMTSNRPYRKGLDPEIGISEIEKCSGSQFDPEMASAFVTAYRAGKVDYVLQNKAQQQTHSVVCPFCSTYIGLEESAAAGDTLDCTICRRKFKLTQKEDEFVGELA